MLINRFSRYQKRLTLAQLFPQKNKQICACGCGQTLPKAKKRWFSEMCNEKALIFFYIIKGDTRIIREQLELRDNCVCAHCHKKVKVWHADHIVPVFLGGGGCDLTNFQTLCVKCHDTKTTNQLQFKRK